ncbi:MAG: polymorphic rane protein, partial [Phycisphaerales bacterium]|nr:polymorphic rane protein [Phycisphaerales bacterium]
MMAFTALVNFQPAAAVSPLPAGYLTDGGKVYGARLNGLTYGWNLANNSGTDRNLPNSPDQRYDTFTYLKVAGAGTVWELAVPAAGNYSVKMVAGDPNGVVSTQKVTAENTLVVNGNTNATTRWVTGTATVPVTDGKLTIKATADASAGAKINFIEVTQLTASPPPPTSPPPTSPPPATTPVVSGVTLVNAATDKDVGPLTGGLVVNQAQVGDQLTVRANLTGVTSGSLKFALDGSYTRTESSAPYSLFGDNAGPDYLPGPLPVGSHQLVITPYAGAAGTGAVGTPVTISFTVVNQPPPAVSALTLVNASTDADAGAMFNGRTINLAETGPQLSIRADTAPAAAAGSVRFSVDGVSVRVDNGPLFSIGGEAGTDYLPWTPTVGTHRLVATAYAGPDGTGAAGPAKTVDFTVVNQPPPAVASVMLVNAATAADLGPLTTGRTINLALIGSQLNVRANLSAGGSVRFGLDGTYSRVETAAPLALFGDAGANKYNPWTPSVGTHVLTVTPYAGPNASGVAGQPVTVTFQVVNAVPPVLGKLVLVDATTGTDVGTLADGATVDTTDLGTALTVRAEPAVGSVVPGSVSF